MIRSQYSTLFVFSVCILLLTACTKDISYDLSKWERKMVVNSLFNAFEPFSVRLTSTSNILDPNDEIQRISGAEVTLWNGKGELLEILQEKGNSGLYVTEEIVPFPGETYILEVSHPDYRDVYRASSYMPTLSPETNLDTNLIEINGDTALQVSISIVDFSEFAEDYIFEIDLKEEERLASIFDYNPLFQVYGDRFLPSRLFLNDESFNGEEIGLNFYTYDGIPTPILDGVSEIKLFNASRQFYEYLRSVEEYNQATRTLAGNLSNPVNIYTNIQIKGSDQFGLGIFAGAHKRSLVMSY